MFLQREISYVNLLGTRRFTHLAQSYRKSDFITSTHCGTTLFPTVVRSQKITESQANRKMHFALYQVWVF